MFDSIIGKVLIIECSITAYISQVNTEMDRGFSDMTALSTVHSFAKTFGR